MGGNMQPQGHVQIDGAHGRLRPEPAGGLDAPRWRIDNGGKGAIEHGVSPDVLDALCARGHELARADRWSTDFGRGQAIYRMEDGYLGASEQRTDGQAVGY